MHGIDFLCTFFGPGCLCLDRLRYFQMSCSRRVVTFDINYIIFWEFRIAHCLHRKFRFLLFLTLFNFLFYFKRYSFFCILATFASLRRLFSRMLVQILDLPVFLVFRVSFGIFRVWEWCYYPWTWRFQREVWSWIWRLATLLRHWLFFNSWIRLFWLVWPMQICHKIVWSRAVSLANRF